MTRNVALWISLAALPWPAACSTSDQFTCTADAQCTTDVTAGRCEAQGVCSFPDQACPSGRRFGALAGELSGECVSEAASTGPGSESDTIEADTRMDPAASTVSAEGSSSDATSSSSTSTTSTTDPSTTDPSTGGPLDDPYGPCSENSDCLVAGSSCLGSTGGLTVCAPPCEDGDCTYPGMGPAFPMCVQVTKVSTGCVLICFDPDECPEGMMCEAVDDMNPDGIGICGWPAGAGP